MPAVVLPAVDERLLEAGRTVVNGTWLDSWAVRKAEPGPAPLPDGETPLQEKILTVADRHEDELAAAVVAILNRWREGWTLERIKMLLLSAPSLLAAEADPTRESFDLPGVRKSIRKAEDPQDEMASVLSRIMAATAEVAVPELAGGLQVVNPRAVVAAGSRSAALVGSVDLETRATISRLVARGLSAGKMPGARWPVTPDQTARFIRRVTGLHPRQVAAAANFENLIRDIASGRRVPPANLGQSARYAADAAATRPPGPYSLMDSRLAAPRAGMSEAAIQRQVDAYANRALVYRGRMIARTETIWSSNAGQMGGWKDASRNGLIPPTAYATWEVNLDDRTCDICIELGEASEAAAADTDGGQDASGARRVGDGAAGGSAVFASGPAGKQATYDHPPAHPMCRCTMSLHT